MTTFTELARAELGSLTAKVFATRGGGLWLEIEHPGGEHPHQFLDLCEPSPDVHPHGPGGRRRGRAEGGCLR
jgi:hypothetical protein